MSKQDQDAAMERWLREALAARDRTAASECLDAETLAAWSDGALGGSERSFAEAHAARCARCQAMLAAMARSVPEQPVPSSAIRKWVLMLSPAVAAAAAVALWFAVERRPTITLPQSTSPAPSESAASAPQVQAAPTAPAAGFEAKAEADKEAERPSSSQVGRKGQAPPIDRVASTRQEAAKASTASPSPAPAAPAPPPAPPVPLPSVAEAVAVQNTVVQNKPDASRVSEERQRAAQSLPATPPAQTPQVQTPQGQTTQTQQPSTDLQTVPRATPEPKRQSDPRFRAGARADGFLDEAREGLDLVSIVSPGGAVRWRVLRGRIVEHSSDGGASWATQFTATDNAVLLSGAAPSSTVAWLVGRAGMVLVTTDGRTWQRVGFPEVVDLVIVTATDARTATVTTADKRTFVTTNSGQTWIQR
jgi:Photosynthesis system II assembly factor YCF48